MPQKNYQQQELTESRAYSHYTPLCPPYRAKNVGYLPQHEQFPNTLENPLLDWNKLLKKLWHIFMFDTFFPFDKAAGASCSWRYY